MASGSKHGNLGRGREVGNGEGVVLAAGIVNDVLEVLIAFVEWSAEESYRVI